MLCTGEGFPFDFRSLESIMLSPRMSQQTESSGQSSPEKTPAIDTDDTSSLLDGPTPVPAFNEDSTSFVPMDFQISTIGGVYSDYYDRIREDAEWNELGQIAYVPLYTARISHGSFSSDRLSSEGSVSPSLPSPIGEHLKTKRDSSSSVQFPIVPGVPQPFPDPFADRAREYPSNGQQQRSSKPYATIMEPKTDYGLTGGEYGSSSQDSHTDVFGGSQESLNNGYGGGAHHTTGYGSSVGDYGRGYGRQQQSQRVNHNSNSGGGGGGGRMAASRNNRQHYNSGTFGSLSSYTDYNSGGGYGYDQSNYDSWMGDSFDSTNKYGGPISSQHGNNGMSSRLAAAPSVMSAAAAAPPAHSGPLPTAFSRANINDEQKNNLMANLARLCNQRSY